MNNTVCLCGSTRFLKDFETANVELTKRGLSVITISMCLPRNEQGSQEDVNLKEMLDLIHLNKVLRADAVLIVGDGYIGRSTAKEILWAEMHGKPVITQWGDHGNWGVIANSIKNGAFYTNIFPRAREALGLPL